MNLVISVSTTGVVDGYQVNVSTLTLYFKSSLLPQKLQLNKDSITKYSTGIV